MGKPPGRKYDPLFRIVEEAIGRLLTPTEHSGAQAYLAKIDERVRNSGGPSWNMKLDQAIEEIIGRPMTSAERTHFLAHIDARQRDLQARNWMKRFETRQGTITPDFAALYAKKAACDQRLMGD